MQLSDFGSWGSRTFGIGPQFSLPLFDGGRLRGVLNLREAQQQEAAIAYQQTVLRAWHEIDDQLSAYNASQLRRDSLAEAVRQNRIALQTAQRQYVEGRGGLRQRPYRARRIAGDPGAMGGEFHRRVAGSSRVVQGTGWRMGVGLSAGGATLTQGLADRSAIPLSNSIGNGKTMVELLSPAIELSVCI